MQTEMLTTGQSVNRTKRWSAWTASVAVHIVAITALMTIRTPSDTSLTSQRSEIITPLVYSPPAKPLPARLYVMRTPLVVPRTTPPHTPIVKQLPAIRREQPRVATIATPVPPEPVLHTDLPEVQLSKLKAPELPARPAPPPAPVKTGTFASAGEAPTGHVPSPRLEVQTGGFGDGNRGHTPANGLTAASGAGVRVGAFGDSSPSGNGARSGNGKGVLVADAGFGNAAAPNAPVRRAEPAAPAETPVEVLWKPRPVYTTEARAKKLEGNVTLEVVFRATGNIQVVRVVRGLGCGLDESARAAAEQIRFRPGKKDGVPVDRTGLVLITFELS